MAQLQSDKWDRVLLEALSAERVHASAANLPITACYFMQKCAETPGKTESAGGSRGLPVKTCQNVFQSDFCEN